MPSPIAATRERLFQYLSEGQAELRATYLKGTGRCPPTVGRVVDGRVRLLLSNQQLDAVRERLANDDGVRPNVYDQLSRWFLDESATLRSDADDAGRGLWVTATSAAVVFRYLYSDDDYATDGRGGASINGFTEFGFGSTGEATLLLVGSADVEPFNAWLDAPSGPPPFHTAKTETTVIPAPVGGGVLLPNQRDQLLGWIRAGNGMPTGEIEAQLTAFRERFPLERWRRLSGRQLLMEMHNRDTNDSLVYWLEFKKDATFHSRAFGSISGGSAYKFGLFWSASEQEWRSGSSNKPRTLSEDEAIDLATVQRDELTRALDCVLGLPEHADRADYEALQRQIEDVAPIHHHLAFFHKFIYLYASNLLDDYHSLRVQRHVTTHLGLPLPPVDGLFAGAGPLVLAYQELRQHEPDLQMRNVTAAMNAVLGSPVDHWRVGTGDKGQYWPEFRDHDMVAVGWEHLGDLSDIVGGTTGNEAVQALREALLRLDPDRHQGQLTKDARQLWAFYGGMKEGDRVYAAYGHTVYGVGEVTGPYRYESDGFAWASRRPVRWISRDSFKSPVKTGLRTTVHRLTNAPEIQVAAAKHMDMTRPATVQPARPRPRTQLILGPVGQQLERKGQVVLYGPPGTGKTYHALKVAESLVAQSRGVTWAEMTPRERAAAKGEGAPGEQRIWVCSFHPAYGYEDFVEGLKPEATESGALSFVTKPGVFRRICERAEKRREERFVLIIDEFNRGDAPRIFGELLTLLELDKRERVRVELPLSGDRFTVPSNVRILATMNTADRSISLLDAAMRRRFAFVEYMPDASVLDDVSIDGLSLPGLLDLLNERLLQTLGEAARNLQVGHAYLMAENRPIASVRALRNAVRYDIFPLLEEYCSESPTALAELLGEGLYDARAARFRDDLMATGREADFIAALMVWDPQRLGTESDDELLLRGRRLVQVELFEWQSLQAASPDAPNALTGLFLDDERLGVLGKTGAMRDRLTVGECRHGLTLRARQHVGVLQLGPVRVSIRPKMSVSDLWSVVCYAYGFDQIQRTAPVDLDLSGTVVDLLCQLLLTEVERLWRAGIGRAYQPKSEWLSTPRGRPDLTALARRGPLLSAELPCHYHHFSTDTDDNRLVIAALVRARQLATVPRLVAALARASQRAELLAARQPLSARLLSTCERGASRLNAQYASVRQLAALLFDGGGGDEDQASGPARIPGFLWNMANAFERFVTRFLVENAKGIAVSSQTHLTNLYRLDAGGPGLSSVPTPRPDLMARDRKTGRAVGVYDMKYRDLWATSVPRDILYQLSTYALAVNSDAPSVVLYPAASGVNPDMKLAIQVVGGRDRLVVFRSVDWSAAARLVASGDGERAGELARRWLVGV